MSMRMHLKLATREVHEATEEVWFSKGHFEDLSRYKIWLSAMLSAHDTLGAPAARHLNRPDLLELEARRRAALVCDLNQEDDGKATCEADGDSAWAWGVHYALNGSALGASVLLKSNSLQPGWPIAYLCEMRAFATGGHLKAFFDALECADVDQNRARAGAEAVFSHLARAA